MRLLVDTCTLIWMTAEPQRLSKPCVQALDNPESELFLSDCTVWEICQKWQSGKLKLPEPPRNWCQNQIAVWKLEPVTMERSHLFRVSELPDHHRDPFDRLLVSQALEERLTIVTPDSAIQRYPVSTLW